MFINSSSKTMISVSINRIYHALLVTLVLVMGISPCLTAITCPSASSDPDSIGPGVCPNPSGSNAFVCDTGYDIGKDNCVFEAFLDVEGTSSLCRSSVGETGVCYETIVGFKTPLLANHGLTCEGRNACLNIGVFAGPKGTVTCKTGGAGTNPAVDIESATCGSTGLVDGDFDGLALIIAGCLICEGANSCGKNIMFIDNGGDPDAQFSIVPTGFVGSIGSGCSKQNVNQPSSSCFSRFNTVEVKGKGVISMDMLEIGDYVKSNSNTGAFTRILSWMHVDNKNEVEFLQIHVDKEGVGPLEVSRDHFLYTGSHKLIRAQDIQVGDSLARDTSQENSVTVTEIVNIKRHGLYAPLTESGYILVSGVCTSSYVSFLDYIAPTVQVFMSHTAMAPLRVACAFDFAICKTEVYSMNGFSMNLDGVINFGLQYLYPAGPLQWLLFPVVLPLLAGLLLLEFIFFYKTVTAFVMAGFLLVRMSFGGKISIS